MLEIRKPDERVKAKGIPAVEDIDFGRVFTDYYFSMSFRDGEWRDPEIKLVAPLDLHPGAVVLHYGQEVFEGLKAFRRADDSIALFRPECNARRFAKSARRLCMPAVAEEDFVQAVSELVQFEQHYVPRRPGSLYLRPTLIGSEPCIKVSSSEEFIFYVLALPAGSYFKGNKATGVSVYVATSTSRASPGGLGGVKAGANYAGTLHITAEARKRGCAQVLFLDSCNHAQIEEIGAMNVFFVRNGGLVTPPLSGTILEGYTRECVLQLARDADIKAEEEPLDIQDVVREIKDGTITEAMGCGTAAGVIGISSFQFEDGTKVEFPGEAPGKVTAELAKGLEAHRYGELPDSHGWLHDLTPKSVGK